MKKLVVLLLLLPCLSFRTAQTREIAFRKEATKLLREQILAEAHWALTQQPVTVTASSSPRSAGGKHDFYSEGDYWWPNPASPDSAYIQRDGMTNPDNFVAHRQAMIRLSKIIGALASAYKITGDASYVRQALLHLNAWFVNDATRMNPDLRFAQAIKGRFTGRGIGIIDTIQLMEVAQGIVVMADSPAFDKAALQRIKGWFSSYLTWLTTHPYGQDEMNAKNNHGTCWTMQVAAFARLTGDTRLLDFCRTRYEKVHLPEQMAADGSFPLELKRTKPFGYSLFNLDAMAMLCQILSDRTHDLWAYRTPDGRSMERGIAWLYPYIADKSAWPLPKDVMYWENWPVAQPALLFGASAYGKTDWYRTWAKLDHDPQTEEVIRNLPVRHVVIWF